MADFYPDQCLLLGKGVVLAQMWTANPCALRVIAVLVFERARNDVDLFAAEMCVRLKTLACGPAHQCHLLCAVLMQWQYLKVARAWFESFTAGVDNNMVGVIGLELMQLYQQHTTFLAERCVAKASGLRK